MQRRDNNIPNRIGCFKAIYNFFKRTILTQTSNIFPELDYIPPPPPYPPPPLIPPPPPYPPPPSIPHPPPLENNIIYTSPVRRINLRIRSQSESDSIVTEHIRTHRVNSAPALLYNTVDQISIDELPAEFFEPVRMNITNKEFINLISRKIMCEKIKTDLGIKNAFCTICQYDIELNQQCTILECNHIYHEECSKQWFTEKCIRPFCPCCRKDIRDPL